MSRGFKKFFLLWSGELISSIGGGLTSFGLTVYVFNKTGSAGSTALIALLAFLPNLLLGVPAGVLADRIDRRLLMMLGDGLSAVGLIYILICMQSGGAEVWQICLGVTVSSVFSSLMDPAYKATVSDLLTEDEYVKASGLVNLAGSARYLISPFLAGLLLAVSNISLLLIIDICTFLLTVITTAVVRRGLTEKKEKKETSFSEDLKCGWKAVAGNKGLITLVAMSALMTFCMGAIQILSEPMVLDFESSKTLGIVETICASGMLVTSVLLGAKGMKKGIVKALCLSLGTAGLCMFGFGFKENLIVIAVSGFVFFTMLPVANSSLDYLVRTNISNELQGRAWGVIGFISQLGYVLSYGLSGVIADCIAKSGGISVGRGSGAVIMISGILLTVSAVILYLLKSVRKLERSRQNSN
ncbi:MAG: MFS transporter [Porcipelethomonas sp.]